MRLRVSLHWPERILFIVGLLFLGIWLRGDTAARVFPSVESTELDEAGLQADLIGPPARLLQKKGWFPETLERGVFGRIEIPRLGITAPIAEGTGPDQLDRAVGHISTTAFPGQPGNCALAGHRDSFLRGLGDLRENDVIRIDTLQDTYTYEVEWGTVVGPRNADVLEATAAPSLTLVTCYPFSTVGPAPERFVVRARLVAPTVWVAP